MTSHSLDLETRILAAQTVNLIPPTSPLVPYKNIGELLLHKADQNEDTTFLIFYAEDGHRYEFSYSTFAEDVRKTASFLSREGIKRGDRIATVSHNHSDVVAQYFAAFLLGAVVVPISVGEDDGRIAFILSNSSTKLLFVQDEFLERIDSISSGLAGDRIVVSVGPKPMKGRPHYRTERDKQPTDFFPKVVPTLTDEALLVYTSGTTGNAKGVILTHYNLLVDAMAIAEWHQLSNDQRMMCVLPIHHVNGIVVTLMTPLYVGASVVLNQRFQTSSFFERIGIEHVSIASVVPTILQFLLRAKLEIAGYKLSHLRHIICGAGPLTVELVTAFEEEYQVPVVHGYGLSETTCYSCFLPIDLDHETHRYWLTEFGYPSIGVPLPTNDMTIHDENGKELDEGEKGEIVIRGHNLMKHYHDNQEANETTFAHGWFRSGDEGFFRYDDQGRKFFFITGRIKELIIRGGVNISPFEIDEVLMKIHGIETGIAVGFENDWYGEEVGAVVRLRNGLQITEEEILSHCRKRLPFHKSPKVVVFDEVIPVTSTGKYQRTKCRSLFANWKTTQFTDPHKKADE